MWIGILSLLPEILQAGTSGGVALKPVNAHAPRRARIDFTICVTLAEIVLPAPCGRLRVVWL